MCSLWRSPMTRSPESTSGDFILNLAIVDSGKLVIGTRQYNNWRLHEPPDFLPFCQPGALSTRLYCRRMPRHHTRPPGRYNFLLVPLHCPRGYIFSPPETRRTFYSFSPALAQRRGGLYLASERASALRSFILCLRSPKNDEDFKTFSESVQYILTCLKSRISDKVFLQNLLENSKHAI